MGILCTLLNLYLLAVFAFIILSWFPLNPSGPVYRIYSFLRASSIRSSRRCAGCCPASARSTSHRSSSSSASASSRVCSAAGAASSSGPAASVTGESARTGVARIVRDRRDAGA